MRDAGWLYLIAGLVACAAGLLLPAKADLQRLREQLDTMHDSEQYAFDRLNAHSNFLEELDEGDPDLLLRLASSQLNLIPANEEAILLSTARPIAVTDWIERTVLPPRRARVEPTYSRLHELATGRHRLWLFGGGVLCVFVGLLLGPGAGTRRHDAVVDVNDVDSDDSNLGESPPGEFVGAPTYWDLHEE